MARLEVWSKHSMESCQIHSGSGDQRGQTGEKIQGFKDDVSGPITIGRFEVVGVESAREKSLFLISLNESPFFQKPDNSLNKAS